MSKTILLLISLTLIFSCVSKINVELLGTKKTKGGNPNVVQTVTIASPDPVIINSSTSTIFELNYENVPSELVDTGSTPYFSE